MSEGAPQTELLDFEPTAASFLEDVLHGLSQPNKSLPCKYLYDERGSELFEKICDLEEYYPTRTELAIMHAHVEEMAERIGRRTQLVEFGCGTSMKTRILLDHLHDPLACVLVDISREHLEQAAERLAQLYPAMQVLPVCADFTQPFELPELDAAPQSTVVYFPGSTIGNFSPHGAAQLLQQMRDVGDPTDGLLVGIDLKKDRQTLEAAYNDGDNVTAAFNLNLLVRINRELDADFCVDRFEHRAVWNEADGRIEMHLRSLVGQTVEIDGQRIDFHPGETICTEHSHKYSIPGFTRLAASSGFVVQDVWTDPLDRFAVLYCTA